VMELFLFTIAVFFIFAVAIMLLCEIDEYFDSVVSKSITRKLKKRFGGE